MCTASSLSWDCFSLALSCDRDRAQVVHLSLAAVPWKRCERHCNVKDFNVLIFQCRPMLQTTFCAPFALDLIILAMHIWILVWVALLNRVGDARIQTSNWFGTGWLEFRSNGMGQCRTDNANIPVHPVQPNHMIYWARLCDIPDASFLTTLFVGVSGKHFFMGLVKRIGSLNFVRLRACRAYYCCWLVCKNVPLLGGGCDIMNKYFLNSLNGSTNLGHANTLFAILFTLSLISYD